MGSRPALRAPREGKATLFVHTRCEGRRELALVAVLENQWCFLYVRWAVRIQKLPAFSRVQRCAVLGQSIGVLLDSIPRKGFARWDHAEPIRAPWCRHTQQRQGQNY